MLVAIIILNEVCPANVYGLPEVHVSVLQSNASCCHLEKSSIRMSGQSYAAVRSLLQTIGALDALPAFQREVQEFNNPRVYANVLEASWFMLSSGPRRLHIGRYRSGAPCKRWFRRKKSKRFHFGGPQLFG
jgi:hypothetical protein